ncbi:MAG: OmpA family protein [Alphaproteobacteria bacterium]|nr:OmpA family protein [Alphaproteobacteria bacterium]
MARTADQEIIVVKKKIEPEVHGGSAWKVAYADFVTAMMAFFLLLWLLNATTEDQKQGISNYFEPVGATKGSTGSGGVVGGNSATDPGPISEAGSTQSKSVSVREQVATDNEEDISQGDPSEYAKAPNQEDLPENTDENRQFDAAKTAIQRAVEQVPELVELYDAISVEVTRNGLRIRLMDTDKVPLFDRGGTELNRTGRKLMKIIYEILERMPNKLQITGHTTRDDETAREGGSNWRISLKRASSGRRTLVELGTPDQRFKMIDGRADRLPLNPDDPNAARNRRIEVVLLRHKPKADAEELVPPSMFATP